MIDKIIIMIYYVFAMETNEKNCENCRYFVQYYLINKHGTFSRVSGRGHCVNGDKIPAYQSQKHILKNSPCEFWEPEEIQIAERREHITETLCEMKKHLKEISLILKDDT